MENHIITFLHIKLNKLSIHSEAQDFQDSKWIHFTTDLKFLSNWGSLWKQCEKISVLWLRLAPSGLNMMKYFSVKHKLHFPFPGLNGLALAMGVHLVFWRASNLPCSPLLLKFFHMYVLNVVCFSSLILTDLLCPANLFLKWTEHPVYDCCCLLLLLLLSVWPGVGGGIGSWALYTTSVMQHCPGMGHSPLNLAWQLQCGSTAVLGWSSSWCFFKTFLLWIEIMLFMFFMVL